MKATKNEVSKIKKLLYTLLGFQKIKIIKIKKDWRERK